MTTDKTTAVANVEHVESRLVERPDARQARLVAVGKTIQGPQFVSNIQGRRYPKVEWWTTIGSHAGLTALEVASHKVTCADHEGAHYGYEATVEVMDDGGITRARASMVCMSCEARGSKGSTWGDNGEYAVKSMALTRATSKAFRINLSYLAVMAGLEATPADEVPEGGFADRGGDEGYGICPEHGVPYFKTERMKSPAHKPLTAGGPWCNKPESPDDLVDDDTKAEWNTAMQAVQDTLDALGLKKQAERKAAVVSCVGDVTPSSLTVDELLALSDQLKAKHGKQDEDDSRLVRAAAIMGAIVRDVPDEDVEELDF